METSRLSAWARASLSIVEMATLKRLSFPSHGILRITINLQLSPGNFGVISSTTTSYNRPVWKNYWLISSELVFIYGLQSAGTIWQQKQIAITRGKEEKIRRNLSWVFPSALWFESTCARSRRRVPHELCLELDAAVPSGGEYNVMTRRVLAFIARSMTEESWKSYQN